MSISIFLGVSTVLAILYAVQATAIWDQDKAMVQCVAKLTPCRPYVNSEAPPPLWCCHPLRKIVENDATCLCEAFKHPDMLALIHLTQEAALNLISSCGPCKRLTSLFVPLQTLVHIASPTHSPFLARNRRRSWRRRRERSRRRRARDRRYGRRRCS